MKKSVIVAIAAAIALFFGGPGAARADTDAADPAAFGVHVSTPVFYLKFVVDKNFDRGHIYGMLHHDDPAGLASRSASMGVPRDTARRIHDAANASEVSDLIAKLVDERYGRAAAALDRARKEYTDLWQPVISTFSATVTAVTAHAWVHPGYVCVVSVFHPGLSDWYGSKIAARYDLAPELKLRIVAHELILSHVFQLVRARYSREQLDDRRLWAFSEISAVFILSEPSLSPLWPKQPLPGKYFGRSNYPQLVPLEAELFQLYSARHGFDDYIDRSVPVLLRFQSAQK